jgi:hypothetical protein
MQRRNALATDNVIKNILKCLQVWQIRFLHI